jgi:hypothetical protein
MRRWRGALENVRVTAVGGANAGDAGLPESNYSEREPAANSAARSAPK